MSRSSLPEDATDLRAAWSEEAQHGRFAQTDPSSRTTDSQTIRSYTSAQEGLSTETLPLERLRHRNPASLRRESVQPLDEEHPVQAVQEEWSQIKDELPPQISSR
jgi:hypothetical protein